MRISFLDQDFQDRVEAGMDETLSGGFSGFVYDGMSCCVKTASTLNLLRSLVKEEDKTFYIYPALRGLTT